MCFSKIPIFKSKCLKDPYLNGITCTDPLRWKTFRFHETVI